MNRILVIAVLAATMLLSFNACKVENDDEAKLQVYVERNDQSVYDAMVRLYLSEDDFKAQGDNFVNGKATDCLEVLCFQDCPKSSITLGLLTKQPMKVTITLQVSISSMLQRNWEKPLPSPST